MSLHRRFTCAPAPDRDPECELWRWLLTGPSGAVGFAAYCYPPGSATAALAHAAPQIFRVAPDGAAWLPAVVDCHAPRPIYDDHERHDPCDCDVLPGGGCFYDGSELQAKALIGEWAAADWDEETIWATLAHVYNVRFDPDAEALRDTLDRIGTDPGALDEAVRSLLRPAPDYLFGDPERIGEPGFMDEVRPGFTDRQRE